MRIFVFAAVLIVVTASCVTIPIRERDAFDNKKTVTLEELTRQGLSVASVTLFPDDSTFLRGWWLTRPDAMGTVLYLGGNGFLLTISKDILTAIYGQKVNVLAFDYRGYGESRGMPTVAGLKRDALAAYHWLVQEKKIAPEKLVLHGHSIGTFMALHVASKNPAAGLVLESPITNAKDLTGKMVPWILKPLVNFKIDAALLQDDNRIMVTGLSLPVLLITGAEDKITPSSMAKELYDKSASPEKTLRIIPRGGHNDLPLFIEYRNEIGGFYRIVLQSL